MHRRPQFEPLARLAAAGCGLFGPWVLRGLYCPAGRGCSGPSSRVGALILPGAAAAALAAGALWVWLCRLGLSWVRAIDSRGCVCPAGCCCGGFAAGALLGWLCPLGFGRVHGHRLARVRLSCQVQLRRLCRRCAFGLAVPLVFGWVHGLRLALARLSCRVQLRRLCRRCALGLAVPLGFGWVHGLRLALARLSCRVQLPRFAAGAFLVCFAAIPAGSIAYAGEALSVGIPWLR